jgi:putative aminopeptidase FrvX
MDLIDLTRELCELSGPSGHEYHVARAVMRHSRDLGARPEVDPMGNVAVVVPGRGQGPALLLSAHMDEVGFVVRRIEESGFLRVERVGGADARTLPTQPVWVHTAAGDLLPGHFGTRTGHMAGWGEGDRTRVVPYDELYVDIGVADGATARGLGIAEGNAVGWSVATRVYDTPTGRFIVGKSFDDRAGCALQLKLLEGLLAQQPAGDVILLFSVQEEVGVWGAEAAAQRWLTRYPSTDAEGRPAVVALALDQTAVGDIPDVRGGLLGLGRGPAIKLLDHWLIPQAAVVRALEAAARRAGVATQREVLRSIGTDGGPLSRAAGPVATGVLSIPSRYSHSPAEMVCESDLRGCLKVLEAFTDALPEMDLRPWGALS